MLSIQVRADLDPAAVAEVLDLLDAAAARHGTPALDEHKQRQLRGDPGGWSGVLAYDPPGARLVGYAHVRWNAAGHVPRATVEVVVHPDADGSGPGRDVAARVLAAARAAVAGAGGGVLYVWARRVVNTADTAPARAGFTVQRELGFLERRLAARPAEPALPDGVVVRAFRPGVDDAELLRVNNAAFAGHPEQGGWGPEALAERTASDWFDPAGLLLAEEGGRLLGFHWTKVDPSGVGEVYVLGIDPAAQGRGLGRALLRAGLASLYERGCRRVGLYVDCAQTGATHLYATEGFHVSSRDVCYEDAVAAARS